MPRPSIAVLPITLLILGTGSCSEERSGSNSELGPSEWQAHPVTRIGSLDDPEQALSRIGHVLIGPGGELFVSQPMSAEIRVYGADGAFLRSIGRRGGGPGEFEQLMYIGLKGDTLYAAGSGRVSFFSLAGDYLASTPLNSEMIRDPDAGVIFMPGSPAIFIPVSGGEALVRPGVAVPMMLPSNRPGVESSSMRTPHFRTDSAAVVLDTVAWTESRGSSVGVTIGGTSFRIVTPFTESPLSAPFPDGRGLVIVEQSVFDGRGDATFRIVGIALDGDTLFAVDVSYDPIPTDADYIRRHAARAGIIPPTSQSDRPSPDLIERELGNARLIPAHQVPVRAVAVARDGSIWLQREDMGEDPATWQVFSRNGTVQGIVRLPARAQVVSVDGDTVAAIELDELDVPYVLSFRLES